MLDMRTQARAAMCAAFSACDALVLMCLLVHGHIQWGQVCMCVRACVHVHACVHACSYVLGAGRRSVVSRLGLDVGQ